MPLFKGNPSAAVELLYNPHQFEFLDALDLRTKADRWSYHRLIVIAGRRGGKTKIGAVATARKSGSMPKGRYWACAPTFPLLQDYTFPAMEEAIPASWIKDWAAQNWTLILKNEAIIQFRSLDDPDRGRGPGLDGLWIDEARQVSPVAWETLQPALVDRQGQAWLTTTPNGQDWCYRRFWEPAVRGVPGYWGIRYKTSDNPTISAEELDAVRETTDPLWFAQEYEADFVTFAGAVYGAPIESQIIRADEEATKLKALLPDWPRLGPDRYVGVGLDPGADHPFAGVVGARANNGDLVIVGEYLERNRPINEHVRGLRAVLDWHNPAHPPQPAIWPIDRSQKQTAYELALHGIIAIGAPNSVADGIRRVQAWLAVKRIWFVQSRCPRLIEQLRNYKWAEHTAGLELKREKVIKIDDDLPDALRYLVMDWPDAPTRIEEVETPSVRPLSDVPETSRWQVDRMRRIDARDRGNLDDLDDESGLLAPTPDNPFEDFWEAT